MGERKAYGIYDYLSIPNHTKNNIAFADLR